MHYIKEYMKIEKKKFNSHARQIGTWRLIKGKNAEILITFCCPQCGTEKYLYNDKISDFGIVETLIVCNSSDRCNFEEFVTLNDYDIDNTLGLKIFN